MDARPILFTLAKALREHGLEAVLIGNAAAALQGALVTTLNFDFLFRKTPGNMRRLKALAKSLGAVVLKPYYPASDLFRVVRDEDSLQLDFMASIHGVKSFSGLRSRAARVDFDGNELLVADLADIIASKRAAGRPRAGRSSISWKRRWMKGRRPRKDKLEALKAENDLALRQQIRRLLQLPMKQRTHFLRKRVAVRASCL